MDVYLMRHGEATSEEENPTRPLTADGRVAVERVARRAAAAGVRLDAVEHSGILRARQTAEILAEQLAGGVATARRQELQPLDPVQPVGEWLLAQAAHPGAIGLVGHLPFMERLVAWLLVGDERAEILALEPAALVKLVPTRHGAGFAVEWVLAPAVS